VFRPLGNPLIMTTIAVSVMQGQAAELISEQPYTVITVDCWVYTRSNTRQHGQRTVLYKPEITAVSRDIYGRFINRKKSHSIKRHHIELVRTSKRPWPMHKSLNCNCFSDWSSTGLMHSTLFPFSWSQGFLQYALQDYYLGCDMRS
jgi:hypothetical protein